MIFKYLYEAFKSLEIKIVLSLDVNMISLLSNHLLKYIIKIWLIQNIN